MPLALVTAALAAASMSLGGLALWLGLLAVPVAAAVAFVAVSDLLEGRGAGIYATTSSLALALIVIGCAVRSNTVEGTAPGPFATWALVAALVAYSVPAFAWVLETMKVKRTKPKRRRRRRRPAVQPESVEAFDRAA